MVLNFEKEKLVKELKERKPKKVLVQLPEGIKQNAIEITKTIEDLGIEVIISGETCWGGCSLALQEAEALGADLIIHFGHAKFIDTDFPVIYIEVADELNLEPIIKKSLAHLELFKKIGLSYSIQHKQDIEKIKSFYESEGKEVILSEKVGHSAYEGHITGCEFRGLRAIESKVDCFVIIGNRFHSIGASLAVKKPVILVDVYNDEVSNMEGVREKILRQRFASIEKFKDAKNIGIIIEIKPGQQFGYPKTLIKKIKEGGKNVVLITMNELSPEKIMNFYNLEAFVQLACPRISLDDFAKYPKPIITFREAIVAVGEKSWSEILDKGLL